MLWPTNDCLGLIYQKRGNIFTSNLSTLAITVSAKAGTKCQKYLCLPVKDTVWLRIVLLLSKYAAIFSVTLTPQNVSISSTAYQLNVSKLYRTIKRGTVKSREKSNIHLPKQFGKNHGNAALTKLTLCNHSWSGIFAQSVIVVGHINLKFP